MKRLFIIILTCLLVSCNQSGEEKILGTWMVVYHNPSEQMRKKITMEFRKDHKLLLDVASRGGQLDHHEGTYELSKDAKTLFVYREGDTSKKNRAEIVELTGNSLVLIDLSSSSGRSDTMWLEKVR